MRARAPIATLAALILWAPPGCGEPIRPIEEELCGNGRVDDGEECDDGSDNDDALPNACRTSCRLPACGDGVTDDQELCDDGDDDDDDACHNDCTNCLDSMMALVYRAGSDPWGLALADLDNDGDLDVVVANSGEDRLMTFSNQGGGLFAEPEVVATGDSPFAVVAADLNNDTFADVAVANGGLEGDVVTVHLNRADGSLGEGASYPVGLGPHAVAAADLDHDGDRELLVLNRFSDDMTVLSNLGDGTFEASAVYEVGGEPIALDLGDLDGDGDLDLAIADFGDDGVRLLFNDGGAFSRVERYSTGRHPRSIALGDLDGDGDLDLVVANAEVGNDEHPGDISVHLNEGGGLLHDELEPAHYDAGRYPLSVALGDLDGDGDLDLAAASRDSDSATVKLNRGDGSFSGGAFFGGNRQPRTIAMGDLDGDGDLDLAIANFASDEVVLLLSECL